MFGLVLVLGIVAGRSRFFQDPGTFWHIRLGEDIAQSGQVPHTDTLTAAHRGAPWVDQSWLFDWLVARLFAFGGWPALAWFTGMMIALVYAALAFWLGALTGRWTAGVVAGLGAAGFGGVHFLTRPHLFTFAGVAACLALCRAYVARGSRWVCALPVVVALWANLHGGFVAGPFVIAVAAAAAVIDAPRDRLRWRRAAFLAGITIAATGAAVLNPYGVDLFRHVWHLLVSARVTDLIQEYQPGKLAGFEVRKLEIPLLIGLVALVFVPWGAPLYDLVHAAVWLHLGLSSLRHLPLFGIAMSPVLAQVFANVFRGRDAAVDGKPDDTRKNKRRVGIALAALVLASPLLAIGAGPDSKKWPFAGLKALDREPVSARLFHDQDWGGLIALSATPQRAPWIDDRFELLGRQEMLTYLEARRGGPAWDAMADRLDLVWVRPACGLSRRLETDSSWKVVHRDAISVLFRRAKTGVTIAPERRNTYQERPANQP